ncbi:TRAP transporter substrate-binding protein [Sporosarcina newyorkensis]|uniref:Tripartite ATP-independent transporter solute receptor, DctP family n=1 Tax=Sporosarcina newyorkensis TaxID=759851 RepID=A0A1T4YUZ6_9BACL|nr:TRAP transporter substrate-binding protein [Sporosarcina newyorkensis]SKB05570.1 tripartite ATP-independent transporter solute receptor, DctP family [Sporosarcina newyorkensis]
MMKNIKSMLLFAFVIIVGGILVGCGNEASGKVDKDSIEIRIANDSGTEHPVNKALAEFKESVEDKSDGRIKVKVFPAAQLGTVTDAMEQTRRGDIEMSFGASTLFAQSIPEFAVWESFYLFDDAEHAHRVFDGEAGKKLLEPLEAKGLTGLGFMEIGFRNFSNNKRPIEKMEDLKGLKIRGYSPIQIKGWESLGVSLTNLAWPEVFTSLQQNLIDGQESATTSFYEMKFFEAQNYWSLTNHIYTDFLWYANKDFMESLSNEDRQLIEEEVKAAIDHERELIAEEEVKTLGLLKDAGININEVSLEERHKMGEVMNAAVKKDIIDKTGQELYDFVLEQVEAERK